MRMEMISFSFFQNKTITMSGLQDITVGQYLIQQLKSLGIKHVFGVPGDYAFPINDAITNDPEIEWIGDCNELNATYAADGYARIRGYGAVCTTYGVGELCTLGGIAGAYSENVPIVHIVGMPASKIMSSDKIVHHSLGNHDYHAYERMVEPSVAALSYLTPENAFTEINRVLRKMVQEKKPVYFCLPGDYCDTKITQSPELITPISELQSNESSLKEAKNLIEQKLREARNPVILAGNLVDRFQLSHKIENFIEHTKIPFAGMASGKAAIDESLSENIGMYQGQKGNKDVCSFVENSDCVLLLGVQWGDMNTGFFSTNIPVENRIEINIHNTKIGNGQFNNVEFRDIIEQITNINIDPKDYKHPVAQGLNTTSQTEKSNNASVLSTHYLYPRLEKFFKPNDIVVIETGTTMYLNKARLPKGAKCINQPLWAAIGYATPAAFGACIAAPERRVVLISGDGAFQMTAQELSPFFRYNTHPVIFIINNDGYLIERVLCKDDNIEYNDLAKWNYAGLVHDFGASKSFLSEQIKSNSDLENALTRIENNNDGTFLELITDRLDSPPFF